jgi:mono/diheme cytochrome c family protein
VGPGIDRILRLARGANYLFGLPGGESMMRANALFTWGPGGSFAPTGVALRRAPGARNAELYVALYGAVYDPGVNQGKRVLRFELDDQGLLAARDELAVLYGGKFFSSITDVANVHGEILFADLYGAGDPPHEGKGLIYRLSRTAAREATAEPEPVTGEALFTSLGCAACHDLHDGDSRKEGPALGGLGRRLEERLASDEYRARTEELARREGAYFQAQRATYAEIAALSGRARSERWFRAHVRDPRFDHPEGKMPSFAHLTDAQLDALAKFLLAD